MSIFQEIKHSVYSPEYYETIYHRPFGLSMRYFLSLILLLSLLVTAVLSLIFVPHVYRFTTTLFDEAAQTYPSKLELIIKDGEASSNVAEPYFIAYPPRLKAALKATDLELPDRFVTISTRDEASLDLAKRYHTMILVGENGIVNSLAEPGETLMTYATSSNFTLTKAKLLGWHETYRAFFKFIPPLLVLFIFVFFLFVFAFNLLYLLIAAPLIILIASLLKQPLSFSKAYQYGLHAVTAAILVDIALLLIPGGLSLLATLAIMLVVIAAVIYLNLRGIKEIELNN
jgi:hypothetical protein